MSERLPWVARKVSLSNRRTVRGGSGRVSAAAYEYPNLLVIVRSPKVWRSSQGMVFDRSAQALYIRAVPVEGRDPRIIARSATRGPLRTVRDVTAHNLVPEFLLLNELGQRAARELLGRLWLRNGGDPAVLEHAPTDPWAFVHHLAYPFLRGRAGYAAEPGVPGVLHARTAREATIAAFGVRRARRDLIRAVGQAPVGAIVFARAVRSSCETDWLAEFLTRASQHKSQWEVGACVDPQGLRTLFALMPNHRRRVMLLRRARGRGSWLLQDTARMAREWAAASEVQTILGRARDWQQVHDDLARYTRRMHSANRAIPVKPLASALDGKVLDGLGTLRAARQTHDLIGWGEDADNCIGSYGRAAVAGTCLLFAIEQQGRIKGTVELTPRGTVSQAVWTHNQFWNDAEQAVLEEAIIDARQALKAERSAA